MTILEIKQLAEAMIQNAPTPWMQIIGTAIIVNIVTFAWNYFLYNVNYRALRKDITDITRQIEELKGNYQMRSVALMRRLETHQMAFAKWQKLVSAVFRDDIGIVCKECRDWWNEHCIYMESNARDAFIHSVNAATFHGDIVRDRNGGLVNEIKENWNVIIEAGNAIIQGAELPPLPAELLPQQSVMETKK
jgi:hypothetical protein